MSLDDNGVNRRRRKFIKAVGITGAVGLAGCSGGGDGGDGGGDGSDGSDGGGGGGGGGGGTATGTPSATPPDADTVLTYWTLFGGGDGVVMASIIDKFNQERPLGDGVGIRRQRVPWDQYYDRLFTALTGDAAPDMAIMHGSLLRRFSDVLVDPTQHLDASLEDDYLASHSDLVTINGEAQALPMDFHPAGIYYNKTIFEEAGLDPESPPSNWEEFKAAGDTIVSETDNHAWCPTPYQDGVGSYRAWSGWVKQAGGELFNEDASEPLFNNEVGQEMTQTFYDMTGDWGWAEQTSEENWGNRVFQNGNLGMVTNGTWYVNVMRELEDFDWGFFKPYVAPGHEQNAAWADGHTVILPQSADRNERKTRLAAEAASWITTQNPEWGTEAGHLPASREISESGALEEAAIYDKTLSKFLEMAEAEEYFFHPQWPQGDPNDEANWSWLVDVWAHNSEPDEAIQGAEQTINNAIGN
ncbi:extracellular solute-binding protein [Halosimplex sp. TS25]|uniref:extracellular solute-binding protein n=1 Tax=Halosimplex rarum TaxID=3396619 RepID=UPI0039ED5552